MFGTGKHARGGKVLGAALIATAVCGIGQTGVARADTFVPLPGGVITRTLADGTVMTVRIDGESAKISGSMGDTPVHRNTWVSGRASVDLDGPSAPTATIKISPGYVVGCQVDIGGISGTSSGGATASQDTQGAWSAAPTQSFGGGVTFGPGLAIARLMLDLEKPDDYGMESHKRYNKVPGPHASVTWVDETFSVDGCGGFAQARSFVAAEVDTTNYIGNVLLWGQPFSIG
ncbi:MspA family porin [Nocardia crassostreae]|uniref:MspA family porin n=1 Tax=Nocardia crassostreae TaxID=53428 RepID=UPI00082DE422|nr:MspA family porin [Nocardia crassostreae]